MADDERREDTKQLVAAIAACVAAARANDRRVAAEGSCPTCGAAK